ncbi:ABC transporter substrate-binding protein [Pseudothauera rhizosphaerae]|uniref:ABC transporter substrate-binding protein n=1 Tax=Pseudothauera rhizosphaerae TaxID=2565932 RepID=A0A4S4AS94_9RHOO|nr:ABC transporter substrate-binding protein [Pseudothauera rhizosphaerae]THF62588.1 ABC transporter substrate-binding protein [Pseudothauera rhizosphaerae]
MLNGCGKLRFRIPALALLACGLACGAAAADAPPDCAASGPHARAVVDMAGRTVTLPPTVNRIATVGSVPVINGYLFTLGAGRAIVNGLPPRFTQSNRWWLQTAIAPYLADRPVLQGQISSEVDLETLVELAPDLVITMDRPRVRVLEAARIPVLFIEWKDASDIRANMHILGCALDRRPQGEDYLRYLDDTMRRIRQALAGTSRAGRPKVLYFSPNTMATPLDIANWWIEEAGGESVTAGLAKGGTAHYSHEQLLLWNPDILIVNSPEQETAVYRDERFAKLRAVRNGQVYVTPTGAHAWGQRTVEQPLTVLWAAKLFHPALFADVDLSREMRTFYRRFFDYPLTDEEAHTILMSRPR